MTALPTEPEPMKYVFLNREAIKWPTAQGIAIGLGTYSLGILLTRTMATNIRDITSTNL